MRAAPLLSATPLLFTSAALLATSACSPKSPEAAATDTALAGQSDMPVEPMSDAGSDAGAAATPQAFVDQAAASDMFEIESSKLAATMAKSTAIKSFAAMMIADHTKSTAALKAAAGKTDGVKAAPTLTAAQQADLDALKSAGGDFDTLYAAKQAAGHEKALALLEGYAGHGPAGPLKDFATKTAPVVEGHLGEARKLNR
jgi:putative membrane protein